MVTIRCKRQLTLCELTPMRCIKNSTPLTLLLLKWILINNPREYLVHMVLTYQHPKELTSRLVTVPMELISDGILRMIFANFLITRSINSWFGSRRIKWRGPAKLPIIKRRAMDMIAIQIRNMVMGEMAIGRRNLRRLLSLGFKVFNICFFWRI